MSEATDMLRLIDDMEDAIIALLNRFDQMDDLEFEHPAVLRVLQRSDELLFSYGLKKEREFDELEDDDWEDDDEDEWEDESEDEDADAE